MGHLSCSCHSNRGIYSRIMKPNDKHGLAFQAQSLWPALSLSSQNRKRLTYRILQQKTTSLRGATQVVWGRVSAAAPISPSVSSSVYQDSQSMGWAPPTKLIPDTPNKANPGSHDGLQQRMLNLPKRAQHGYAFKYGT